MSKVKKAAGVTGERNIGAGTGRGVGKAATKRTGVAKKAGRTSTGANPVGRRSKDPAAGPMRKAVPRSRTTGKRAKQKPVASGVKGKKGRNGKLGKIAKTKKGAVLLVRGRPMSKTPSVIVVVKALDPLRKCGPNTTVQHLYRVDESVDGRRTAHLVFFDRHGWYCEHGRTCPAVGHAKKHNGQIARVS